MESMDETDPSLNTHPNTEPASDSISNNSSATTTQIEPEPEIYLSDEPDSSDTDTDSTIFVKGSEDDSDATIPNTSILIDSDNKKNSRNDPENQPSSSSVVEIPINSVKRSYDVMKYDRDDNDQICPICLDMWTSEGDHRLCSLKCGHLFGKSCIFNWLVKQKKKCCPQCNKDASSYDIRELFATKLIAMDCSEKTRLEREIEAVREEKRKVEVELAKSRLYAENFKLEVNKLQTELAKYRGKTENSSTKKVIMFCNLVSILY